MRTVCNKPICLRKTKCTYIIIGFDMHLNLYFKKTFNINYYFLGMIMFMYNYIFGQLNKLNIQL